MKLGIFDSGLGGLLITKAIQSQMRDLDILYLGDTLRLPYGNRSDKAIYRYTKSCMEWMFEQGCSLILIACNTASAAALRKMQQEWLPVAYPDRNIIGVVVPALEEAVERGYKTLGLIATNYIVSSNVYQDELSKISPQIRIVQKATPLLVPLIENNGAAWLKDVLRSYIEPLKKKNIECLILGCTHYPVLKPYVYDILGDNFPVIAQDDIVPPKLESYIKRHPEYPISCNGEVQFCVTDRTQNYINAACGLYGSDIDIEHVHVHDPFNT